MNQGNPVQRQSKPSLLSGIAVSAATIVLSLLVINMATEMYFPDIYHWDQRLMFFSEGAVFQNKSWGGFVYQPNARFDSRTIYITNLKVPRLVNEYEYQIKTNSSGLVQLADISPTKPSIIFLGDSFTEGQGASPWFYDLEREWPETSPYQIINGGILGTGFEAWKRLYSDLSSSAKIDKIVVIFISDDWTRPVWQVSQHDLECLQSPSRCDGTDDFLGLFADPAEAEAEIRRIAIERINYIDDKKRQHGIFKSSAIYQRLLKPAYHLMRPHAQPEEETQFERSETAIKELVRDVGAKNIIFIHLPQKDELSFGLSNFSKRGRDFIRQSGLSLIDGSKECHLTISDYHTHDGHPNAAGYRKIEQCVARSVKQAFRPPSAPLGENHAAGDTVQSPRL